MTVNLSRLGSFISISQDAQCLANQTMRCHRVSRRKSRLQDDAPLRESQFTQF